MEKNEEVDEEISEGSEYSQKSEFSKPKLVEESVRKCVEARSDEMIEGHHNYKLDHLGNITAKIWIADSRKVFDSHMMALRNLLSPEIKNNEAFKKVEETINEKKKTLFDKHCYIVKKQVRENGRMRWVDTEDKVMPSKDAYVVCENSKQEGVAVEGAGLWNSHITSYWNELTPINDELFAALNELIDSLNYFKQRVGY